MEIGQPKEIEQLKALLSGARRAVFLGGAGVSTESGIPDFRSERGVFAATEEFGYAPETLLSHAFFLRHTDIFYAYYRKCLLYPDAEPNDAHRALAALERQGKLAAVVTQNIDGLHQRSGSRAVLELHGSVHRSACMRCRRFYSLAEVMAQDGVPKCACGGTIKPDVVLYGEALDQRVLGEAAEVIAAADLLLIGGTSLTVYPAAGLVKYFRGEHLVVINLSNTDQDLRATLCIARPIGRVLRQALDGAF